MACNRQLSRMVDRASVQKANPHLGHWRINNAGARYSAAASLRRAKRRRYCGAREAFWRQKMGSAFTLVLRGPDLEAVKQIVLQRATAVGEGAFARHVMLPMIDARRRRPVMG